MKMFFVGELWVTITA